MHIPEIAGHYLRKVLVLSIFINLKKKYKTGAFQWQVTAHYHRYTQAGLWAVVTALAGNGIAQFVEGVVTDLRRHELAVVLVVAVMGLVVGLRHWYKQPKIQP